MVTRNVPRPTNGTTNRFLKFCISIPITWLTIALSAFFFCEDVNSITFMDDSIDAFLVPSEMGEHSNNVYFRAPFIWNKELGLQVH